MMIGMGKEEKGSFLGKKVCVASLRLSLCLVFEVLKASHDVVSE